MNRGTALPLLLWESVRKPTFIPAFYEERGNMINHKGLLPKRAYRGRKQRFSTLIFTVYRPLGTVMRTGNHFCPETLLAVVGVGLTELIVLPSAVASQNKSVDFRGNAVLCPLPIPLWEKIWAALISPLTEERLKQIPPSFVQLSEACRKMGTKKRHRKTPMAFGTEKGTNTFVSAPVFSSVFDS